MKYVIIGNSAAAVGCVEGIRQVDREGAISIISSEPYHTYSRPLISYLVCGRTDRERMKYRPDDFYEKNGVKRLLGKTVISIDSAHNQVILDDGTRMDYEKLMVATGSTPFIPPVKGLSSVKNCFTFLSLDDACALQRAIRPESRVLIVGAGLIGLKCAEGLHEKVASIHVVDMAGRILSSILEEEPAGMVQRHLEENGISFHLSDSVEKFEDGTATLKSGGRLPYDIVVVAVGVRPNMELVKNCGGMVDRGVIIDGRGRTSLPDIYSAGDCTESLDISCGERRVLALLPNAYMQGECAGVNMAGGEKQFDKALPMNAIGFLGLHMITAGSYRGEAYVERKKDGYKKLYSEGGLLKGFMLVGDVARAGIYTSLIREQTPLSAIDYDLICQEPQLMAFSKSQRQRTLGGVRI